MRRRWYYNCNCDTYDPSYARMWMGRYSRNNAKAMDILKIRYARGEITREEFENMKKDIL